MDLSPEEALTPTPSISKLEVTVKLWEISFDDDGDGEGDNFLSKRSLQLDYRLIAMFPGTSASPQPFLISFKAIPFGNGQKNFQIDMDFYDWLPISKRILAFHCYPNARHGKAEGTNCHSKGLFAVKFQTPNDLESFRASLSNWKKFASKDGFYDHKKLPDRLRKRKCPEPSDIHSQSQISEFDSRTDEGSATQYFQFYGSLFQQQNMMQDFTRTATYQRAILENYEDFRNKVVLDVGAGTGILSFFAVQAGARRVYAVEASSMAAHCQALVDANGYSSIVQVIMGKIEDIELPEQVDVIISEPMGYMLVNERMLESYVYARKFLKSEGRMFPNQASLHLALFSDEQLFTEQSCRSAFWSQDSFHGINLSTLKKDALEEIFRQPVVDSWHTGVLVSRTVQWTMDFEHDDQDKLCRIEIPFELSALRTAYVHGIACWFDVAFCGSKRAIWLSTAPTEPLTHWYQVRCLLKNPILVMANQMIKGRLLMLANNRQSYDLELDVDANGQMQRNSLDLKSPYFRFTGQPITQPAGHSSENPSDQLNQTLGLAETIAKDLPVCDESAGSLNAAAMLVVNGKEQQQRSGIC